MENKRKLTGIGYWHSIYEPMYPDPGHFVDDTWDNEEKEKIAAYLRSGHQMDYAFGGVSWCRFRCGFRDLGSLEFTDGKYLWPEGLVHYIEKHNVKLPQEVIDFMLVNKAIEPVNDNYEVDWTWWENQSGWNTANKTFNDRLDIGILTIAQVNDTLKLKQEDVLRQFLRDAFGVTGKLKAIDAIINGQETQIKGRFQNVNDLLPRLPAIGLHGTFQYLSKSEYGID
jgi:hypothetical protein